LDRLVGLPTDLGASLLDGRFDLPYVGSVTHT
jgi:hypothetical protein